jgi:hypothetical protein
MEKEQILYFKKQLIFEGRTKCMRFIFDKVTRYLKDINFSSFLMFLVFFNEKRFLIFFDL